MFVLTHVKELTPLHFFLEAEKKSPDAVFLRQPIYGRWHAFTFRDVGNEMRRMAGALRSLTVPGSTIAVLSKNCAHWIMCDLAIMYAGMVSVPVYPTLSAGGIREILEHSEAKLIFVGKLENFPAQEGGIGPHIRRIIFPFYGCGEGLSWQDLIAAHSPLDVKPSAPDQIATIMYSSGTTGTAKGVILTHGAFGFVGMCVRKHLGITKPERFFSYLPLSHIAERALMEMVALESASTISFAESVDRFALNLQHEKPTIFGGVPRIYARFQNGILAKIPQERLTRLLSLPLISGLLKAMLRKKLGLNKARVIVSGAAPIPVTLLQWFKAIGIEIREMYGMTENTAFSHANFLEVRIGSVGQPWPEVETKLGDDNEVLIRHAALMKGYFRDEETTRASFTDDGFLKTGDQGEIDEQGFLTLTGRIKDQFKTAKAKFIAPAPIEMKILSLPEVEQACVTGSGLPQPIVLLVLSEVGNRRSPEEVTKLIGDKLSSMNEELESYERIHKAIVLKNPWTIENNLLTPSLKVKRNEVEKTFGKQYAGWYARDAFVIRE